MSSLEATIFIVPQLVTICPECGKHKAVKRKLCDRCSPCKACGHYPTSEGLPPVVCCPRWY